MKTKTEEMKKEVTEIKTKEKDLTYFIYRARVCTEEFLDLVQEFKRSNLQKGLNVKVDVEVDLRDISKAAAKLSNRLKVICNIVEEDI